jgi:hypothetical protein
MEWKRVGGQARHLRRCGLLVWIVNSTTEYMHLYIVSYLRFTSLTVFLAWLEYRAYCSHAR